MTTPQKLTRARVQLLDLQPFFGTLCLRLKLIPGDLLTGQAVGRMDRRNEKGLAKAA
jgi:hypothetical protein